ncbi:RHS repeat domain-containing protein [Pseudoalteromonas sp.]|uniref:RHS repeat domain-containing protein n=1 Tax=Pseudoalteromonas sp. TaxID=53249 RepID=UPI003517EECB
MCETLYLKGLYERLTLPSENVEHKYYVGNTVVINSTDAKQSKTVYTHKDHLGSTVTVTDANGSVVQHINYDAWGKQNRFYTSSSLVSLLNQQSPVESKGYTGHKEISDLGIIHMNGRIYDYNLGRFMSVDPVIQSVSNSQGVNPYSYIMNNPLAGTDPTGYEIEEFDETVRVSMIGSRIKRTVAVSTQSQANGDTTVSISGGSGAARTVVKNAITNTLTKSGFNIANVGAPQTLSKGADGNGTNENNNGVTTSDGVAATGIAATGVAVGIAEHADTHPVWVGKNGQVKANNSNYHGNRYDGSKAEQIAKAKEIAKKLGIPLAAASAFLRGVQLPDELATMRARGASNQDIALQKVDAGVDITMAGVGVLGLPGFTVAVGYTILDYSSGGNASKALVEGVQNIPVPTAPKVPEGPEGMKTFLHRLTGVPEFNFGQ